MSDIELPRVAWGLPGHEREYCVNIPGFDAMNYIPHYYDRSLAYELPGFRVDNRGSRIELVNRAGYGIRDDAAVIAAVESVLGEVRFVDASVPALT